jgi:lambda repressor-like predicted transcriptional regulator
MAGPQAWWLSAAHVIICGAAGVAVFCGCGLVLPAVRHPRPRLILPTAPCFRPGSRRPCSPFLSPQGVSLNHFVRGLLASVVVAAFAAAPAIFSLVAGVHAREQDIKDQKDTGDARHKDVMAMLKEMGATMHKLSDQMDYNHKEMGTKLDKLSDKMDAGFARVDDKLEANAKEMGAKLDKLSDKMDAGFARVDDKLDKLSDKMDAGFSRVNDKLDDNAKEAREAAALLRSRIDKGGIP